MNETPQKQWKYLGRKPGSYYEQLFINSPRGWVRASNCWSDFIDPEEPRTPEQIAENRELPLEMVLEAIEYCRGNPPEIQRDWEMEEASIKARGWDDPDYWKKPPRPPLTAQEIAQIKTRR